MPLCCHTVAATPAHPLTRAPHGRLAPAPSGPAHLHHAMQKNNPGTLFEDPSCPDVLTADPGATVTCQVTVGEEEQERREFLLRMDVEGLADRER